MEIEIKILNKEFYKTRPLPKYETKGSVGVDLYTTEDLILLPGEVKMVSTGLAVWIGSNSFKQHMNKNTLIEGQIRPRSGLGHKGLILGNTIGTIDEDYQGEIKISAWNRISNTQMLADNPNKIIYNDYPIELKTGDRIAQLVFAPVCIVAKWVVVQHFSNETNRGSGGFGSTGA